MFAISLLKLSFKRCYFSNDKYPSFRFSLTTLTSAFFRYQSDPADHLQNSNETNPDDERHQKAPDRLGRRRNRDLHKDCCADEAAGAGEPQQEALPVSKMLALLLRQRQHESPPEVRVWAAAKIRVSALPIPKQADLERHDARQVETRRQAGLLRR